MPLINSTASPDPSGGALPTRQTPPRIDITLWPNRSLTQGGLRWVFAIVTVGLSIPLIPLLGTRAAFGLLPFLVSALIGLYWAISRNTHDGKLSERLLLWPDLVTVERVEPNGTRRIWHANPHWVTLHLKTTPRVESYLTLKGNGREIELGAFLSPEERVDLHKTLASAFADARV
ncbi:MAG: DUF2244 domain-containing protein [Pseudomonadota bacterium]